MIGIQQQGFDSQMMLYCWPEGTPKCQGEKEKKKYYYFFSLSLFKMNHGPPRTLPSAALRAAASGFHFGESEQITFGSSKPELLNII